MPSDTRLLEALKPVAREREAFRSALAAALEQVRGIMTAGNHVEAAPERVGHELGAFAAGRIQFDRFAEVATQESKLKKAELNTIRHAQQLLTATLAMGDELHVLDTPENSSLAELVHEALATSGRAFAAAYAIEMIRAHRGANGKEETLLAPLMPERWTRAEREIAPPLVVRVDGADLNVSGFPDLLQGAQKIVLLVDGIAPPAALARLISPNVFVMQCRAIEDLTKLSETSGPAIAAVIGEPAAVFTWNRTTLSVEHLPSELPKRPLRTTTVARQREDFEWLKVLAKSLTQKEVPALAETNEPAQPGDKLAAWLLRQVEMPTP